MSGKNNQDQPFIKDLDKLFDKEYKNVLKKNKQQKSPSYRPTASSSFYSGGHDYDDHGTGCFPSMTNIFGSPTYADKVITYVPDNKNYGPGYNLLDKEKAKAFKVEEERRERELYNKTLQMVQTSGATQRHTPETTYNTRSRGADTINTVTNQGAYDPNLQQAIEMSRLQHERDNKRRTETEWQTKNQLKESIKTSLQEQLFRIIHTELYSLEQVLTIKTALGDYETRTGTTIFDMGQISDLQHRDPNDTSKLVLYVAKIMEYSVNQINWLKLFEFFGEHIRRIELELTNIVHMTIYNQDKHDRDSESSFVHDALQGELVCTRIRGDGNCLWNSVSTALYGNYSRMESLRLLTATTLVKHRELFENYLDEQKRKFGYNHELSFDGLIRAAMDLQVWGDELHVMALSLALHKPIYSYGSLRLAFDPKFPRHYSELKEAYEQQSIQNHFRYIADEADVGAQPILLYYNGRDHYSVVLPVRDDVVALVPQMQILEPIFKRELKNTDLIVLDEPKQHNVERAEFVPGNPETNENVVSKISQLKVTERDQKLRPTVHDMTPKPQLRTSEQAQNQLANKKSVSDNDQLIKSIKSKYDDKVSKLTEDVNKLSDEVNKLNTDLVVANCQNNLLNSQIIEYSNRCHALENKELLWKAEETKYQEHIRNLSNQFGELIIKSKEMEKRVNNENGDHPGYNSYGDKGVNGTGSINNKFCANEQHGVNLNKPGNICEPGWKFYPNPNVNDVNMPPGLSNSVYRANNANHNTQPNTEIELAKNGNDDEGQDKMETDI